MALEEAPTGDITGIVECEYDDEALRQIENELAVVEEAMSERQRSLAEVDQRLNDLQSVPKVKASLDTVTEATVEDVGATPLLLNSRSVSSSVGAAQVVGDFVRRMENGDYVSGISDSSCEPLVATQKTLGVEDSKGLESPIRQALKQPRSTELSKLQKDISEPGVQKAACGTTAPATSTPGASASLVSRMVSMPTRSDSIPRPPRVMSGSLNSGSFRGPLRHAFVNQPSVAVPSTSPWRHSSQHLANGSSDNLSRGVSPSPATPRGSSMPADTRRIFPAQAVASPQPSVSSPRSSAGMTMPGSMTPLTPRLPLQAARATISGYPSASSGALGGQSQHSLEGTPRPRSVSAGQVTAPSTVSQTGGNLSARSVSTIPLTQYGSRFSAVSAASSTGPMSAVRASSRGATPQPISVNGCRFVPVASPLSTCEVSRGRENSQNPGSHRTTSASTSITRGGSPTPGVNSVQAPHSSPAVVRQSSAVRPLSSLNATRQVSTSSNWPGSSSPAPGSFEACVGSSGFGEDAPAVNSRALSPPHVAAVAAAAAAAVKSGTLRHNTGGHLPGNSTPQPQLSRYAYVHSNPRRDNQPQAQRDARRRGRM